MNENKIMDKINNNLKIIDNLLMENGFYKYISKVVNIEDGTSQLYDNLKQTQQENARLKEENQALLTLVNWFEECGMGFDNIAQDDIINWEKFEEETEDMGYIESMIYYAKKYNEKQNLKEN